MTAVIRPDFIFEHRYFTQPREVPPKVLAVPDTPAHRYPQDLKRVIDHARAAHVDLVLE